MFYLRLRKNVPFEEIAIKFEFHDLAKLSQVFYHVCISLYSRVNEIPRLLAKIGLTGTQHSKGCHIIDFNLTMLHF